MGAVWLSTNKSSARAHLKLHPNMTMSDFPTDASYGRQRSGCNEFWWQIEWHSESRWPPHLNTAQRVRNRSFIPQKTTPARVTATLHASGHTYTCRLNGLNLVRVHPWQRVTTAPPPTQRANPAQAKPSHPDRLRWPSTSAAGAGFQRLSSRRRCGRTSC